jgi:hypothetical protein
MKHGEGPTSCPEPAGPVRDPVRAPYRRHPVGVPAAGAGVGSGMTCWRRLAALVPACGTSAARGPAEGAVINEQAGLVADGDRLFSCRAAHRCPNGSVRSTAHGRPAHTASSPKARTSHSRCHQPEETATTSTQPHRLLGPTVSWRGSGAPRLPRPRLAGATRRHPRSFPRSCRLSDHTPPRPTLCRSF